MRVIQEEYLVLKKYLSVFGNEDGYGSNKTVMVHISNLRDKLETGMNGEKFIHTVWGVGYKIEK